MTELIDTQRNIDTICGATFPYEFGLDFLGRKVVIFNKETRQVISRLPSELQRLAADETLDPHRHALYQGAWNYWLSEQAPQ